MNFLYYIPRSTSFFFFFFYRLKFHQVLTSSFVRFLRCLSWRSLKLFHFQLEKFERLDRQGILNFEFVKLFKLHCPVASLNLWTSKFALRPVSVFFFPETRFLQSVRKNSIQKIDNYSMERRLVIALGIRKSGFFLEIPIVRIEIA